MKSAKSTNEGGMEVGGVWKEADEMWENTAKACWGHSQNPALDKLLREQTNLLQVAGIPVALKTPAKPLKVIFTARLRAAPEFDQQAGPVKFRAHFKVWHAAMMFRSAQ